MHPTDFALLRGQLDDVGFGRDCRRELAAVLAEGLGLEPDARDLIEYALWRAYDEGQHADLWPGQWQVRLP